MMVAPVNPIREKMMPKLEQLKLDDGRVDELVKKRYMSKRFGDYTRQLLMLDFLAHESEVLARYGCVQKSIKSLTEMKFKLDSVAGILIADGELETDTESDGLRVIKNPNFDNVGRYKGLYDFAQQKYEDAVNRVSSILEAAA